MPCQVIPPKSRKRLVAAGVEFVCGTCKGMAVCENCALCCHRAHELQQKWRVPFGCRCCSRESLFGLELSKIARGDREITGTGSSRPR